MSKIQKTNSQDTLLNSHELPAFECVHYGDRPVVFCCEHASNRVPEKLHNLGLSEELLQTHIAWDIGAGELCNALANHLCATAIFCNYSRLVVDCNRNLKDPTAFIEISDHIKVPGNQTMNDVERQQRSDEIYYPFHNQLDTELTRHCVGEQTPVMISIHSFTPSLSKQNPRPWHIGILWDKDPRIPEKLLAELQQESELMVGDNQPYSGKHIADYSIDHHAEKNGFAHVCIEVRQDLLESPDGQHEWSQRLSVILKRILDDGNLYRKLKI